MCSAVRPSSPGDLLQDKLCFLCNLYTRQYRMDVMSQGVILYIKEYIQAYEITLEKETYCDEAVWCNIITGNSTLTIGLVYRSSNINKEDSTKIQNAIKEVSKVIF